MTLIIQHKAPKRLLTPASGYLKGYTHTLNPYAGCAFGCTYCYVRKMPVALFRSEEWGTWVNIKNGAAELLRKELKKASEKGKVTIFMSSSTDPYQPVEAKEKITRSLLEVMAETPPDFLFLQTRSPLIARDLDLLKSFQHKILVSMTIETDREDIRKTFSPFAPPIQARMRTLKLIVDAGIPAQAAVSPLLPSTKEFAKKLSRIVKRVTIDDYFMGDGSNGRRTKSLGVQKIYEQIGEEKWYSETAYLQLVEMFRQEFEDKQIFISQSGFLPNV
jgi:DNA repair photolyase